MRFYLIAISSLCLSSIACQEPKPADNHAQKTTNTSTTSCYQYTSSKDTIYLRLTVEAQVAKGMLTYALNGKDRNTGTLNGTLKDNLLLADYNFQSEGQQSTRQVAFKKSGDVLLEGFGPVRFEGNNQVFENPQNLQYDTRFPLRETPCQNLTQAITDDTPPPPHIGDPPAYSPSDASTPRAGTHPITLHWISWDRQGKASLIPGEDGWFIITGRQENNKGDYLTINGRIHRISPKELEFDGKIVTKTSTTNGGEPCLKEGKQRFFAKGSRSYFRLQNMENCEGGMLVDYVDIYPGTSSL